MGIQKMKLPYLFIYTTINVGLVLCLSERLEGKMISINNEGSDTLKVENKDDKGTAKKGKSPKRSKSKKSKFTKSSTTFSPSQTTPSQTTLSPDTSNPSPIPSDSPSDIPTNFFDITV